MSNLFLGLNDTINTKNIIKGKTIPLTILMILACSLLTGDTAIIMPSLLFIGIFVGIMKKTSMNELLLTSLIGFVVGSFIAFAISLITVYYTEGGLYAISVIQYSWIYIIFYTFIGCIGSALGYYIREELENGGK